jgi:VTC domain
MTMTTPVKWFDRADKGLTSLPTAPGDLLQSALDQFAPVGLADIAGAALMDRTENKYLLPLSALPALLSRLAPEYQVLTIAGETVLPYRSLYLDTPDFSFYYAHHNGRSRRYKVRFRSYEQTNTTFLEVKARQASGRTVKTRTSVPAPNLALYSADSALLGDVPTSDQTLEPKLWVNYQRVTLVGKGHPERVTLDLGLEFRRPGDLTALSAGDVVIVELKRESRRQTSPLQAELRAQGYREGGFSKYGVGCSLLYPVRHNAFKPQYRALEKALGSA